MKVLGRFSASICMFIAGAVILVVMMALYPPGSPSSEGNAYVALLLAGFAVIMAGVVALLLARAYAEGLHEVTHGQRFP